MDFVISTKSSILLIRSVVCCLFFIPFVSQSMDFVIKNNELFDCRVTQQQQQQQTIQLV